MNLNYKNILDEVKTILAFGIAVGVLYLIALKTNNNELREIKYIKQNYGITKGIIIKKKTFRGNSIIVKYYVEGTFFEEINGFDERYTDKINEGDSVTIKYSKIKPELLITEFNRNY